MIRPAKFDATKHPLVWFLENLDIIYRMATSKSPGESLQFQDRDIALLSGLFECRVMTASHIATLYFDGKREYTKKRLQKLKAAGFIRERRRLVNEPSVLFLTRKAFTLLKNNGRLSGYPALGTNSFEARANVSGLTLRHELEIMDVKAAFHSTLAKAKNFAVVEFSTWPLLYQFETPRQGYGANALVKPDGFIRIHENEADGGLSEHTFFLEVDRSSEKQDTLITRAGCYVDYYKSGGFAERNGAPRSAFKDYPFRVLLVLKNAERRNNTAERLVQNNPPILTQVWLTTFAEVTTNPLGAIWIQPVDYRNAIRGTAFDAERPRRNLIYRRQPERELFIERKTQKRRILADDAAA